MIEIYLSLIFCIIMIILYSMNFNKRWSNSTYEKIKNKKFIWYGLRKSKERYDKIIKTLSIIVIIIMVVYIFVILKYALNN
jgi:predicted membrane protein